MFALKWMMFYDFFVGIFFEYKFFRWYGILVFNTVLFLNGCDRNKFFSMLYCYAWSNLLQIYKDGDITSNNGQDCIVF